MLKNLKAPSRRDIINYVPTQGAHLYFRHKTFMPDSCPVRVYGSERNANVDMRLFSFSANAGQHDYVHVAVVPS